MGHHPHHPPSTHQVGGKVNEHVFQTIAMKQQLEDDGATPTT